jgi:hypothetical protein
MAQYIASLRKIPVPGAKFYGLHRNFDLPLTQADELTMVLTYHGVPSGHRPGFFDPWILLQALNYERVRLIPAARTISQPTVSVKKKNENEIVRIRFQSAIFEAVAKKFLIYAMLDNDNMDGEDAALDPGQLISKRAYFERQLDDAVHYPVWDRLLKAGRTREDLWIEIQEKYLFKYTRFLRVECDWSSTGIWGIAFPGSYGTSPNYSYECFDLPKELIRRFDAWTAHYNSMDPCRPFEQQGFRQEWFDKEGEFLATELVKYVDAQTYVEYRPFVQAKPGREQHKKATSKKATRRTARKSPTR